jgi:2-polyprenyl-3-methyl-5-hydroxy-6-metoxy-1,4-benzoquinol methylase
MNKYFIKDGYRENLDNSYYSDNLSDNIIWQPDVYSYAIEYAKKHNIKNIIDIGSGNGDKLYKHRNAFDITFIDFGSNLETIKNKFKNSSRRHTYIEQDFEKSFPNISVKTIKNSIIICSDVIEHIRNMDHLCAALANYSKATRLLVVSTPDRERLYGFNQNGIPANLCHVREWRLDELEKYFSSVGMNFLIGLTRSNDKFNNRSTLYVISGSDFINKKDSYLSKNMDSTIQKKVITKDDLTDLFNKNNIKAPRFDDKFHGLYNPYSENFMLNHFIAAVSSGATYGVNKFKFINQDTLYNSVGSTNIDCSILQFFESTDGEYPLSFTFLYEGDLLSANLQEDLPTISAQHLAVHYLPEMIFGFKLLDKESDTIVHLPNFTNIQNELTSHMIIKRSARLLAGNIKRRILYGNNR